MAAESDRVEPDDLIGARLIDVTAAWHRFEGARSSEPVEVWLTFAATGDPVHIDVANDWRLRVDRAPIHTGWDMHEWGRIEIDASAVGSVLGRHIGETVLAVAAEHHPPCHGQLAALTIHFETAAVRFASWAGDLLITARAADHR